jgi:hypothetical protein
MKLHKVTLEYKSEFYIIAPDFDKAQSIAKDKIDIVFASDYDISSVELSGENVCSEENKVHIYDEEEGYLTVSDEEAAQYLSIHGEHVNFEKGESA